VAAVAIVLARVAASLLLWWLLVQTARGRCVAEKMEAAVLQIGIRLAVAEEED